MNRLIGHQKDLLGGPEVAIWSSGRPPRARKSDPKTSHDAAKSVRHSVAQLQDKIFDAIDRHGAMTSHRLAEVTGIPLVSISPRIKPMRLAGLLREAGREGRRTLWGIA